MRQLIFALALSLPVALSAGAQTKPSAPAPTPTPATAAETPEQQKIAQQAQPILQDLQDALAEQQLHDRIAHDRAQLQQLQQQYNAAAKKPADATKSTKK